MTTELLLPGGMRVRMKNPIRTVGEVFWLGVPWLPVMVVSVAFGLRGFALPWQRIEGRWVPVTETP